MSTFLDFFNNGTAAQVALALTVLVICWLAYYNGWGGE